MPFVSLHDVMVRCGSSICVGRYSLYVDSHAKRTIALIPHWTTMRLGVGDRAAGSACGSGAWQFNLHGESSMSVVARVSVTNRKSASVHELAGTGPRTDPNGREKRRKDWGLLERLEAENLELRNRAIELELQIQTLRQVGGSEVRSARGRMHKQGAAVRTSWGSGGVSRITSRRRPKDLLDRSGAGLMIACASALSTIVK